MCGDIRGVGMTRAGRADPGAGKQSCDPCHLELEEINICFDFCFTATKPSNLDDLTLWGL